MYVVSKMVMAVVPPWILLELRFVLAALALGAVAWHRGAWRVERQALPGLALIGLVGYTGSIGMQFVGTALSGAAMGSLITSAAPAIMIILAWRLLHEPATGRQLAGLGLATGGVFMVIGLALPPGAGAARALAGDFILLGAAATWALYTVLSRKAVARSSSLTVITWVTWFGTLFTAPIAATDALRIGWAWPASPWIWAGIIYLGVVSTAVAFFLWNRGFEYVSTATGSLFFFAQPLVGSLLGHVLLHEPLRPAFYAGALFIALGVYLSAGRQSPEPSSSPLSN